MANDEIQDRTCRCCSRGFEYPMLKSRATRFYCERCVDLSDNVRSMFEHFNKRIKKLNRELLRLHERVTNDGGEA